MFTLITVTFTYRRSQVYALQLSFSKLFRIRNSTLLMYKHLELERKFKKKWKKGKWSKIVFSTTPLLMAADRTWKVRHSSRRLKWHWDRSEKKMETRRTRIKFAFSFLKIPLQPLRYRGFFTLESIFYSCGVIRQEPCQGLVCVCEREKNSVLLYFSLFFTRSA